MLALLDHPRYYRDIVGEAERSNVAFYPVDPRGLVAFDTSLGGLERTLTPVADSRQLRTRLETLKTLAVATDGIAVADSNDLDRGLKLVSDDLSSYYLLGYYSTNEKADGSYRRISVKVTRPGVKVRSRRGYRAASATDRSTTSREPEPLSAERDTFEAAVSREIGTLSAVRPTERLYLRGTSVSDAGGLTLWVAGELAEAFVRTPGGATLLREGAAVRLLATNERGDNAGVGRATIEAGARSFLAKVRIDRSVPAREVRVQAQIGASRADGEQAEAQLVIQAPEGASPAVRPPLFYRGTTRASVAFEPAASPQFRRAETLRAEAPLGAQATAPAARLLDRTGKPLAVPLTVTERRDDSTGRWLVVDLSLAPLSPGDYVLALAADAGAEHQEVLAALRVIR